MTLTLEPDATQSQKKQHGIRCHRLKSNSLRIAAMTTCLLIWSDVSSGQDTPDYYRAHCMICHTIGGGRLTGPDLKDLSQRKDRDWLTAFILNPRAVIDSGDPYAVELFEQANRTLMPTVPGLSEENAIPL